MLKEVFWSKFGTKQRQTFTDLDNSARLSVKIGVGLVERPAGFYRHGVLACTRTPSEQGADPPPAAHSAQASRSIVKVTIAVIKFKPSIRSPKLILLPDPVEIPS